MKHFLKKVWKWLSRFILGLGGLIVLMLILFILFKGLIIQRTVKYINEQQPGVVQLESINLRPFRYFPDLSFSLNELKYDVAINDSAASMPMLMLDELEVAIDMVELIKGNYVVSRINLGDGQLNYFVGPDSISNIETALGIRFGDSADPDTISNDSSSLSFELGLLQMRNIDINYIDQPGLVNTSLVINGLQSELSYFPDTIIASLMVHADIPEASFGEIQLDKPRTVSFSTSAIYDQKKSVININNTMLDVQDALFELSGLVAMEKKYVDISFAARNSGVDLLNFLMNGVLKLDIMEQIGDGSIYLNGNIGGEFSDGNYPEMAVEFGAEELGFLVSSINKEVTGINFKGSVKNGSKADFSEAIVEVKDFSALFPDGNIAMDAQMSNLVDPRVRLDIQGKADLALLNEIIELDPLNNLQGSLAIDGHIDGEMNRGQELFFENAGFLNIDIIDVGFELPDNSVKSMSGTMRLNGRDFEMKNMEFSLDGNMIEMETRIVDIFPYLMKFQTDPSLYIKTASKKLDLNTILKDTLMDGSLEDVTLTMDFQASASEIDKLLNEGDIPISNIHVNDVGFKYPGFSRVSDVELEVEIQEQYLKIKRLTGLMGSSDFNLSAMVDNYNALLQSDTLADFGVHYSLSANRLTARDLFMKDGEFTTLPEEFVKEEIRNLVLKGKLESTVQEILSDKSLPAFNFLVNELSMELKEYPLPLKYFYLDIENNDSTFIVHDFSGYVGESNLTLSAAISGLFDSTKSIAGSMNIQSDMLDIDELMDYSLLESGAEEELANVDTTVSVNAGLHELNLPDLSVAMDLGEIHYDGNELFEIQGEVRLNPYQIIYLNQFSLQTKTGGALLLDGQFNISDSSIYNLSTSIEIDTLNVSDFNVPLAMGDSIYSLEDNFNGVLSGDGIAEFYIYPDFSINLDTSTAVFNIKLENGWIKNFAPLHAIARYTGNKDLDNVQFGELQNSFTLADGVVEVPLMNISSTIGLILLEGEQGLDGEMLYLARVPTKLIRETAWNVLSNQQRKDPEEEEEIQKMETQKFAIITIYGKGEKLDVKRGDQRDEYK